MKKSNFFISIVLFLCFQTVIGQTVPRELTPGQTWEDPDDTWGGTGGTWGGTGTIYTWYRDSDIDTLGNPNSFITTSIPTPPLGYVSNSNDCDDSNENIGAATWWYPDGDGDGYGVLVFNTTPIGGTDPINGTGPFYGIDDYTNPNGNNTPVDLDPLANSNAIKACVAPLGYVSNHDDCNDIRASVTFQTWYLDADLDGFGDPNKFTTSIEIEQCVSAYYGYASNNTDCNDNDPKIRPNGQWFIDSNNDGVYNPGAESSFVGCYPPAGNYIFVDDTKQKLNWTHAITYDLFGNVTGASRTYFDELGKSNVSISKDIANNTTWRTETIYDSFGRPHKTSFPTVTPNTFEKINVLSDPSAKTNFLDKYYSDSNTLNPYQATATQPYSEVNYDKLNPGNVINEVGGNKINGEWKTGYSYAVPAAQEMYYAYGYDYFNGPVVAGKEEVITKFYKSVGVDANGVENVSFSDGEGKVLASARSGGTTSYTVCSLISTQGFVDIHIPAGITTPATIFGFASPADYQVYDLKTGLLTTTPLVGGNGYRIVALTPPSIDSKTYVDVPAGTVSYEAGAKGVLYSVNYYDYALNVYNKTGQLIKSIQPNGYTANTVVKAVPTHMGATATNFISTYKYNSLGQVVEAKSPDEGISKFAYRQDGQIRYSQSAIQADTKVSYTDYDTYGRPVESGVITTLTGIWAQAIANADTQALIGTVAQRSEQTFTVYDFPENNLTSVAIPVTPVNLTLSGVLATAGISSTDYIQNNLSGNVAMTFTKPGATITAITWYSYDLYGRVEWVVQYNEGLGAKTIHYYYDYKGNVKKVIYQKDKASELFVHQYTYNANDALVKAETSTDNTTFITHADYSYYLSGELKRLNIGNGLQGLDYVYTLSGALKSINHPSLSPANDPGKDGLAGSENASVSPDIFGITLDYYDGDYKRTGTNIVTSPSITSDYVGNIKALRFANKTLDPNALTTHSAYTYEYNRNNWLTQGKFGTADANGVINTGVATNKGKYYEGGLTYDANGNILQLQRTDNTTTGADATLVDNLAYTYTAGKNQLANVTDTGVVTPADPSDIEGVNAYGYNAIGQMVTNTKEGLTYLYNTQGLVTQVNRAGKVVVKFYYNERGQRIKKESFVTVNNITRLNGTDYYVLDLAGNVMSNYQLQRWNYGVISQTELPIFGLNRIGVYIKSPNGPGSDYMNYQITDHLGNVRAVLTKPVTSPTATTNFYADYYPFGEKLPTRNSIAGNYRYAFQGQECDPETGMEAFQLRLWDGRIGRWLSPDPYGQHASPYLGMGNNPISMIDPDGGTDGPGDPGKGFFGRLWGSVFGSNTANSTAIQLNEVVIQGKGRTGDGKLYGGDGSGSFSDNFHRFVFETDQYNPIALAWDGMSGYFSGKDRLGNGLSGTQSTVKMLSAIPIMTVESAMTNVATNGASRVFEVGAYKTLRGVEAGLDAHHVGQKALMSKFVPGYNANTAPSILVPKLGHTQGIGVLARGTSGLTNARQVIARDIFELRRVHPSIPNSSLQQLIQMNKTMYPGAFIK